MHLGSSLHLAAWSSVKNHKEESIPKPYTTARLSIALLCSALHCRRAGAAACTRRQCVRMGAASTNELSSCFGGPWHSAVVQKTSRRQEWQQQTRNDQPTDHRGSSRAGSMTPREGAAANRNPAVTVCHVAAVQVRGRSG